MSPHLSGGRAFGESDLADATDRLPALGLYDLDLLHAPLLIRL